jgi:hypothetical protein
MDIGIDYSLIVYALGATAIGLGGSYYMMSGGRQYSAIGFLLASIAIFVYFGLRWFEGMKLKAFLVGGVDKKMAWPPQINYCPDFLSLKQIGVGNTAQYYCVDTMGVTGLPPFTKTSNIVTAGADINNILLVKDRTAATYATTLNAGKTLGVTWEGIFDGRAPSNRTPPYPPA